MNVHLSSFYLFLSSSKLLIFLLDAQDFDLTHKFSEYELNESAIINICLLYLYENLEGKKTMYNNEHI